MTHDTGAPTNGDTVRWGRRSDTFVPTPEWIYLAGLSPQAVALYGLLLAHVNRQRQDGLAWPGLDTLASLLGFRRRQSVAKYVRELVDVGAITVEVERTRTGRRNVYTVNEVPAAGTSRPTTLADFYARVRAAQGTWAPTAHHPSDTTAPDPSCAAADQNQTNATRGSDREEVTSSVARCAANRATRTPSRRIYYPRDFAFWTDKGEIIHYLIKAAIGVLNRNGLDMHPDARSWMADTLSYNWDDLSRPQMLNMVKAWVNGAGDPWSEHGWLAHPAARRKAS